MAAGLEVAFGLAGGLEVLRQSAPQAKNYMNLSLEPYDPAFAQPLLELMHRAERIHFNLTGMIDVRAVLAAPYYWPAGTTNWELRTIWDSPVLRLKTTFYRDQAVISDDEVARLP